MKKIISGLLALSISLPVLAQELPQPSPTSTIVQRIGLTDVEVVYSRPSAKERTIFGDLVPYNELWRTGANSCSRISFSTDVELAGNKVKAGEYGLFSVPGEENWTIVISKQTNLWGVGGYNESEDVVRFDVASENSDYDETFEISFTDLTQSGGQLSIEWADTEVNVPISVDSQTQSAINVSKAIAEANRSYRNAASFYSGQGDHDKAIATIDLAVELDPNNWYTNWVKAEILAAAGKSKEAKKQGKAAIDMGQEFYDNAGQPFTYRASLEKDMKSWK